MTTSNSMSPSIDDARNRALAAIHAHWKLFLVEGILMLGLGILAVVLPAISTLEIELLVGCLFVVGGFLRVATIFRNRHIPGFWWSLWNGTLAMVVGAVLIARPLRGVITLTIAMAIFFVIEAVAAIFIALEYRRYVRHWIWILFSGFINLMLAYLIWQGWPNTTTWVIGLYVGINMVFFGIPLIVLSIAARNLGDAT